MQALSTQKGNQRPRSIHGVDLKVIGSEQVCNLLFSYILVEAIICLGMSETTCASVYPIHVIGSTVE